MANGVVQCVTCGKNLSSMRSGRRHYSLIHATKSENDRIMCQICHVTFAAESYLADHMRRKHGDYKSMKNKSLKQDPLDL